jgi:predicted ATP-grasp superfamily ATP-dependent carboligase
MPSACFKFNEKCEFFDNCSSNNSIQEVLSIDVLNKTSYSSDELFMLCPEKYRLSKLTEIIQEDFEKPSGIGTLVHRGLAEIYSQFKEKEGND